MKVLKMLVIFLLITFPLRATTFPQNVNTPSARIANPTPGDTVLFENFDGIAPGELPAGWDTVDLTALPVDPKWHIDTIDVYSGSYAWWCGEWFGSMKGPGYGNLWRQYLTLDLDLTGVSAPCSLIFHHRYDAESEDPIGGFDTWDGMNVRISTDNGVTWQVITPDGDYPFQSIYAFYLQDGDSGMPGYSSFSDWTTAYFDLSPYVGQSVKIRWWFASDMYCSDEDWCDYYGAWFLDDILVISGSDTIFFDDVESGALPEWTAEGYPAFITGNFWHVVDSTTQPQPDGRPVYSSYPNSAYCGDPNSSLGNGSYTPGDHNSWGLQCALVTPTFSLENYSLATLSFMQRGKGDGMGGYAYIDVSTDGGNTWTEIDFQLFTPSGGDWVPYTVDLSYALGSPQVKIRFRTGSGTGTNHYVYWYVDDVIISASLTECVSQVDDGNPSSYWGDMDQGEMGAILLDNCQPDTDAIVNVVSVYLYDPSASGQLAHFAIHIYEDDNGNIGNELITPETLQVSMASQIQLWDIVIHDTAKVEHGEGVWIAVEQLADIPNVFLLMDAAQTSGRNKIYVNGQWMDSPSDFGDFMIRATMDTTTGISENLSPDLPISIFQISPNPAGINGNIIQFVLEKESPVKLVVYNQAGQKVRALLYEKLMKPGTYTITWNGRGDRGERLPSGVYFIALRAKEQIMVKKSILIH